MRDTIVVVLPPPPSSSSRHEPKMIDRDPSVLVVVVVPWERRWLMVVGVARGEPGTTWMSRKTSPCWRWVLGSDILCLKWEKERGE